MKRKSYTFLIILIAIVAAITCHAQGTTPEDRLNKESADAMLSDLDLFNGLVEEFECTPEFAEVFKRIQIQFGTSDSKGKYRACFIFYNDNTWTKYKVLLNQENVSSYDDAVAIFRKTLEGVEIKDKSFHIRFKRQFPDYLLKQSTYSAINYTMQQDSYHAENDYLSPLTLAQDKADDNLRQTIRNEKYRQAILNPLAAKEILEYDINDEMARHTLQMLRTDEIVANDNLYLPTNNQLGVCGFDGSQSNVTRRYFCLHTLSTKPYKWDFSAIKTAVQKAVNNGQRYIPRMFTACSANSGDKLYYTHINTKTGKKEKHRIDFPVWMADLMAADKNAQWYINSPAEQSESYWIPDYNVPTMRAALISGIKAFGDWLAKETVVTKSGKRIPLSDALLYVEFNPLGSWGEGQMSPLEFTASVDDMLTIWQEFMRVVPNNVVTTGGIIGDSKKGLELTEKIHNTSNNIAPYGFTIEHLGARDHSMSMGLYDKYAGKVFFSGEGAAWAYNSYWEGDCYYHTIDYLKRLQLSYARIQNWTIEDAALNPLKNFPDIAYKNTQMVAFIGYRYVLTPTHCKWMDKNTLRTYLQIANIGSSKCWWRFYETHVIVADENSKIISDNTIDLDITKALPRKSLGTYSLGDENDISTHIDVNVKGVKGTFKIYLMVVDKFGIAQPLYFSNYGRMKKGPLSGCYLISSYDEKAGLWKAGLYAKKEIRK